MLIEGIIGSEPTLTSIGPDVLVVPVENAVLGGRAALIPLNTARKINIANRETKVARNSRDR